ncbi:LLM class flavin-dependent oxidoreductase [Actinoplanes sp. CA-142083]|uniref:LLM class flavin-dependent oxidoreductase n=1 Tax=Actinoplanes sp. CA-142083 TaxID=3239903 RepID=UPI003D8EB123
MTVEFVGMIAARDQSETRPSGGPVVDPAYIRRFARAHEDNGFDRILIAYGSSTPDATQVAAYAAAHTERIGLLIAHRPGFVSPTNASRAFATLDQLTGGRVAVHTITGGSDTEQRRDGDYLGKDDRYARTEEYLTILRRAWSSPEPFSYDGRFYKFEDYAPIVQPAHRIPLYFGGSSAAAYRVGGKTADTYALWGEPLAETAEQIASVQASAAAAGRGPLGISVSFRPILAATDELAWERAERILTGIKANGPFAGVLGSQVVGGRNPENVGSQRLLAAAAKQDRHDRALWTATASASGAQGNSTALVGSPETVAQALLDYVDLGVTTLLIRGYEPVDDAVDYGRQLIPLVRQELRHRELAGASR